MTASLVLFSSEAPFDFRPSKIEQDGQVDQQRKQVWAG